MSKITIDQVKKLHPEAINDELTALNLRVERKLRNQ